MRSRGQQTILVVDIDESLRSEMVRTLREVGFATIEAGSGREALEKFRAHRGEIGLVVIELQIPPMNGLDVAAELERLQPGLNILYMSALHESIAMESIGRRSPERVLLKPFDAKELAGRASQLLGEPPGRKAGHGR